MSNTEEEAKSEMAVDSNPNTPNANISNSETPKSDTPKHRALRWWPVVAIVGLMLFLRFFPNLLEAPPLPLLMAGFMGPGLVALAIPLWWLFASRATTREKIIGLIGLVVIAVATIALLHFTMRGMNVVIYQVPSGLALFGLMAALLAAKPQWRLPASLGAAMIGFGMWGLLQMHGTTGKFRPEFTWRWSETPEEEYLRMLASVNKPELITQKAEGSSEPVQSNPISYDSASWPAFRGRTRDGVIDGITLSDTWDVTPPKLVWKTRIGPGWSSFSIAKSRLYTQEQRGEKEAVVCLDANTGQPIWSHEYPGRFWESIGGAGPRGTPTVGDNALFTLGANGDLLSLNPNTGELIWKRSLKEDSNRDPPTWGWASSPLLIESIVIVHAGGEGDKGILAYKVENGELAWSSPSGNHSYSSPHLAKIAGVSGILMMSNDGLQFLEPVSGESIWTHDWHSDNYRAIQPLVLDDSVLVATSLGMGTRRITVSPGEGENSDFTLSEDWTSLGIKPDFNDFVAYEGSLYGFDGNIFVCVDLSSGKRKWKKGRYGNGQVILLKQAGQLLVITEQGELVLIEANPNKLMELARFDAIDGKTWNHPILVGNRLYIRNGKEAACYEMP